MSKTMVLRTVRRPAALAFAAVSLLGSPALANTAAPKAEARPASQPHASAAASPTTQLRQADPRVQQLATDGEAVIDLAVQRGQLTHLVLPAGETFVLPPATGQGARCDDETHQWCIVAQGRDVFIKAKPGARTNNLILVTERRRFAFDLRAVDRGGVMRLTLLPPPALTAPTAAAAAPAGDPEPNATHRVAKPVRTAAPDPQKLLQERLAVAPLPRNAAYSMAVGKSSEDIAPSMVFDDGRFTYLRFSGNRPLPAVFQTGPDGSEETVNVRMGEDDLLVADRVARRFVLRLGASVVVLVNDGFDLEGQPPVDGTTVPGVARMLSTVPPGGSGQRPATPARTRPSGLQAVSAPAGATLVKTGAAESARAVPASASVSSSPASSSASAAPGASAPGSVASTATAATTAAPESPAGADSSGEHP
jgi:type IV secretion system protein VirB9